VAVEAGSSARQLLRRYGVPLLLGSAAVGGKLGYDYYKDYEERHNLLKPWKGEMIKIDGLNALQAPPITVLGKTLEGFHIVGEIQFISHPLSVLLYPTCFLGKTLPCVAL
jgi:hypothetical protein